MNRIERESFLKSFALFFLSLSLLSTLLYYVNYLKEVHAYEDTLYSQMRLCSFDLQCEQFQIDFATPKHSSHYTLLRDNSALFAYFPISQSEDYVLKLLYPLSAYHADLETLKDEQLRIFALIELVIALLSALFSLYALYPLRSALILTKEFVRDIVHDVNTPLSSLRLNVALLQKEQRENPKLTRIEESVEAILGMQNNLRSYLDEHAASKDHFDLAPLVATQIHTLGRLYPHITFENKLDTFTLYANKEAMQRIMDNLLGNAAKYNRKNGSVRLTCKGSTLTISDTGMGIKEAHKVFKRFYTENANGVGIGLHIVKKLCDELHIGIALESTPSVGTTVTLDCAKLTER